MCSAIAAQITMIQPSLLVILHKDVRMLSEEEGQCAAVEVQFA